MPRNPTATRGYCFTINNPTDNDIIALNQAYGAGKCRYLCYGHEVGEDGTYHLQGYIHFYSQTTFGTCKRLIGGRAHIEARKGSIEQAIDYCKKDGQFEEFGEKPISPAIKNKTDWAEILKRAEASDFAWIKAKHPRIWIQLSHRLQSLSAPETKILQGEAINEWWVGPTGTGKSSTLWELYPNHFQKELNKWWCGYSNEDVVAIEEWSPKNECTTSHLKIWADRYPFTAQIKGGSLHRIRPKKLIVLSNYTIDQCFMDARDAEPLKRRFDVFVFPEDIESAKARGLAFAQEHTTGPESTAVVSMSQASTASLSDVEPPAIFQQCLCDREILDALGLDVGDEENDSF